MIRATDHIPLSLPAVLLLLILFLELPTLASAQDDPGSEMSIEAFENSLDYQQGDVSIQEGLAQLRLGDRFRYLGPEDTQRVLVDAWGNPPESAEGALGMILSQGASPLDEECWAVVIEYAEEGYVWDEDAASSTSTSSWRA